MPAETLRLKTTHHPIHSTESPLLQLVLDAVFYLFYNISMSAHSTRTIYNSSGNSFKIIQNV